MRRTELGLSGSSSGEELPACKPMTPREIMWWASLWHHMPGWSLNMLSIWRTEKSLPDNFWMHEIATRAKVRDAASSQEE